MSEPNPEEMIKNLFNQFPKEEETVVELPAKLLTDRRNVQVRLKEVVYGLLSQDSLTKEQAVLLAALAPLCTI
jgi:hypothetical protein